jgi:hypothetical protein
MLAKLSWGLCVTLVVVALTASAQGQQERGRGPFSRGAQSMVGLAGNEAVQKEIGLTDSSKVSALADEYRGAIQQDLSGLDFASIRDLPESERPAKFREFQTKFEAAAKKANETFEPKLKEALTADQFKRLSEIKVQASGIGALLEPGVVKELGLSDEQQKKITEVRMESDRARGELLAGLRGGGNNQEAMTKIRELTEQSLTKATDVLDAGQKEKFTALKGKPFDLSQLRGRGGRRGNND